MLDYKLLETFAVIIQEGGFDKAAEQLNVTQSAVSQRVRQLEEREGTILLSRSSPPRPTVAGQRLMKHYLQVRLLEDGLERERRAGKNVPVRLSVGINADSLSSWFLPAIGGLLAEGEFLLDLHVDDQEQTHKLLKDGIVVGCISDMATPIQGCRIEYLGAMGYRLLARPEFVKRWFPDGLTAAAAEHAPAVMFTRKDMLHHKILFDVLKAVTRVQAIHYVPSNDQFLQMISSGYAYGMVPDWQSEALRRQGEIIEVHVDANDVVHHYWHCWNIDSVPLKRLSKQLVDKARVLLV